MRQKVETKSGVRLKQLDGEGRGLARIAVLSAVDRHGDTYEPGAFGEQEAVVRDSHNWQGVSLGKARIFEDGDEVLADFRLNMQTAAGREWFAALSFDLDREKSGGRPLQEWSYGFEILDAETEQRDGEHVRILRKLKVIEISPVLQGAGIGTGTLAIKEREMESKKGRPFGEQIDEAIAELRDIAARAAGLQELRAREGRELGEARLKQLDQVTELLVGIVTTDRAPRIAAAKAAARFSEHIAKTSGAIPAGCCKVDGVRIKGRALSRLLSRAIDDMVTDERTRADIAAEIAGRAGLTAGTINAIVSGEINCPSRPPIRAFAAVLDGVSQADIVSAMDEDGCDTDNIPTETRG